MTQKSTSETVADTQTPEMDAWTMATSVLIGLSKAAHQAETERTQRMLEADQNPFGKGVMSASILKRTLDETLEAFEIDLRQHARSCGLSVPDLKNEA